MSYFMDKIEWSTSSPIVQENTKWFKNKAQVFVYMYVQYG